MKTKDEINALRTEVETLNKKLAELTEDELKQVAGGAPVLQWYDNESPAPVFEYDGHYYITGKVTE